MATSTNGRFTADVRAMLHDRILDTAVAMTLDRGWGTLTMGRLADAVGVARQTVYNDVGTKSALGHAIVMRELEGFLAVVRTTMREGDDLPEAIGHTVRAVLDLAERNPVVRDILTSAHVGRPSLIPFLTTDAEELIGRSSVVLTEAVFARHERVPVPRAQLPWLLDAVVRLVISHIVRPADPPRAVARRIEWIVRSVVDAHP